MNKKNKILSVQNYTVFLCSSLFIQLCDYLHLMQIQLYDSDIKFLLYLKFE